MNNVNDLRNRMLSSTAEQLDLQYYQSVKVANKMISAYLALHLSPCRSRYPDSIYLVSIVFAFPWLVWDPGSSFQVHGLS